MPHVGFVHLHTHSEYSFLDGACRVKDLINLALADKQPALAITDHGGMFGAIDFYKKATSAGVKPIIGCEFYIAPDSRKNRKYSKETKVYHHLVLLAANLMGYQNLMALCTIGYMEGFYYRPRIDKEVLRLYSSGIIGLSACIKGEIPGLLLLNKRREAEIAVEDYVDILGKDNFYLEVQSHGMEQEKIVYREMINLSRTTGVPLVATNDIHYLRQKDFSAHDVFICIGTGKLVTDSNRMKYNTDQLYFRTSREMKNLFADQPEAIENTVRIAERCNVNIDLKALHMPKLETPKQYKDENDYLRSIANEGLKKHFINIDVDLKKRIDLELETIKNMKIAGYILIVRDLIIAAQNLGVPVGPGRGSVVGSLVCYCAGITNVNPIKYKLLFERFLNPDRLEMPDIDIDFADKDREKVIDYVVKKYGNDCVCQIATMGKMKARAV
ncbi:MAG: DNA polymerase III subunit alpha, partial [bacterium]